jgi:predicted regulator of Ras-like GTPase activity (Roadblock/LC7/MglB family)
VTGASPIHASLVTLRDVAGVNGSFLVGTEGQLLARDLPPLFDDAVLGEVGGRLVRLNDTFASIGQDADVCVLRFSEFKLYVKAMPRSILCVLTTAAVNMPALKMASNLVARRVFPEVDRLALAPAAAGPATLAAAPGSVPAGPPAPGDGAPPPRLYRGRRVG